MKRLALVALVLAALLAVTARALLDVPRQVHTGSSPGIAARLVGADDDIRYRRSLHLAERALSSGRNAVRARSEAEAALAREPLRAQADNLLGVLSLGDAAADPSHGSKYAVEAAAAFRAALRADPQLEAAKTNLELLLTLKPKADRPSSSERATGAGRHGRGNKPKPLPTTGY